MRGSLWAFVLGTALTGSDAARAQTTAHMVPTSLYQRVQYSSPAPQDSPGYFTSPVNDSGWRFTTGASLLVVVPHFESNPAFTTTAIRSQGAGQPNVTVRRVDEFDYNWALSPRIWLGVENDSGFGLRTRWWHYDQSAPTLTTTNDPIPLGSATLRQTVAGDSPLMAIGPQTGLPGVLSIQEQGVAGKADVLVFTSDLRMDVWDFEATFSDIQMGQWQLLLASGVRYAHVSQHYNSFLAGNTTQFLDSGQSFNGLGPSFAAEARRPVGDLGLTFFGAARAALLFGTDEHSVHGRNIGLTQFPPITLGDHEDFSSRRRMLPSFELELGLEYAVPLDLVEIFAQAGVLGQLWPSGSGAHGNGNMGLIGFHISTGLRF